jgi:ABC-type sugar transport system substrate-binding protein
MMSMRDCAPRASRKVWGRVAAVVLSATGVLALSLTVAVSGSSASSAKPLTGKTVDLVTVTNANPWAAVYNARITGYLRPLGAKVNILATPSTDPQGQVQMLSSAVAEHPNLIFLEALDTDAVAPAIAKAKAEGVTIVNTDGPAAPAVASGLHQVLSNNYQLGQYAAENIIEGLQREGKKQANIGVIEGTASMLVTQERMQGFYKVLSKHPNYKVVDTQDGKWDPVLSGQLATQMFAKYGKTGLEAMYGMADYMAVPIVTAAEQSGIPVGVAKRGLIITGSNCFKVGIQAIRAGTLYGTATEDPGTISLVAAEYGAKLLEGKKVPLVETVQEHRVTAATLSTYGASCSKA